MIILKVINIIALIIFGLIGLVYSIKNRKDFSELIQLGINRRKLIDFSIMMSISGLIMLFAFTVNMRMGLIDIECKNNVFLLIKGLANELINAFGEEFIVRVFVFIGILVVLDNKLIALILSSIIFCFAHESGSIILISSYFLAGLMYGLAFIRFKNIWAPIGLHFGWNYFQGIVFGFPVSSQISNGYFQLKIVDNIIWNGGSVGLEGSILGVAGRILIIILIILITYIFSRHISSNQFLEINNKW
jgi:uncharacterized protein